MMSVPKPRCRANPMFRRSDSDLKAGFGCIVVTPPARVFSPRKWRSGQKLGRTMAFDRGGYDLAFGLVLLKESFGELSGPAHA